MHPESPPASNNKTECYQLDINLLAKAHSMTHSRGDGRISVADITELLNIILKENKSNKTQPIKPRFIYILRLELTYQVMFYHTCKYFILEL